MHHAQFPRPTRRAMLLTTPQWATFTMMVTTSVVFRVELLLTPEAPTVPHVLHIMDTYKVSRHYACRSALLTIPPVALFAAPLGDALHQVTDCIHRKLVLE